MNINGEKCGGIIINNELNKILCVLNKQSYLKGENKWGLPKGHKRLGELIIPCSQREIFEETSLYFEKSRFNNYLKLNDNIYFLIILKSDYDNLNTRDTKEIERVEWKTIAELKSGNSNRDLRSFLQKIKKKSLIIFYKEIAKKKRKRKVNVSLSTTK